MEYIVVGIMLLLAASFLGYRLYRIWHSGGDEEGTCSCCSSRASCHKATEGSDGCGVKLDQDKKK